MRQKRRASSVWRAHRTRCIKQRSRRSQAQGGTRERQASFVWASRQRARRRGGTSDGLLGRAAQRGSSGRCRADGTGARQTVWLQEAGCRSPSARRLHQPPDVHAATLPRLGRHRLRSVRDALLRELRLRGESSGLARGSSSSVRDAVTVGVVSARHVPLPQRARGRAFSQGTQGRVHPHDRRVTRPREAHWDKWQRPLAEPHVAAAGLRACREGPQSRSTRA